MSGGDKMTARLKKKFLEEVIPALRKEFNYKNIHQVPRLVKIVINSGVGKSTSDTKVLEIAEEAIKKITGQSPVATSAKKSVAGFKLREGQKIGVKVTLRGERMYEFLDKLISYALPRIRDFRGLSKDALDKEGNYSVGIHDCTIFPEVEFEDVLSGLGLQINIVTTASNIDESKMLLKLLGVPIREEQ